VPSVCCFALGFFLFFVDGIEEKKEKREGKKRCSFCETKTRAPRPLTIKNAAGGCSVAVLLAAHMFCRALVFRLIVGVNVASLTVSQNS